MMSSIDEMSLLRFVPGTCADLDFFSNPLLEYDIIAHMLAPLPPPRPPLLTASIKQPQYPPLPRHDTDDSAFLTEDMMIKIPGLEEKFDEYCYHRPIAAPAATAINSPLSDDSLFSSPASIGADQLEQACLLPLTQIAPTNLALLFQQKEPAHHNPLLEFTNPKGTEQRVQQHQDKDASKITKGHWTPEEDRYLKRLVKEFGAQKWSTIARYLLGRNGKQCRERWQNHLRPDIKLDTWSPQEEEMLVKLHKEFGSKWAEISKQMPGRTENSIKNVWNATKRRKGVRRRPSSAVNILRDYILSLDHHCSIKVRPTALVSTKINSNGHRQLNNNTKATEGYIGPLPSSSSSSSSFSSSSSLFANQFSLEGLLGVHSNPHMNTLTSVFDSSSPTPASFVGLELGDLPYSYGHVNTGSSSLSNSHPFCFPPQHQLPRQHVQVNGLSYLINTANAASSNPHHTLATSPAYIERWLHDPAKFIGNGS